MGQILTVVEILKRTKLAVCKIKLKVKNINMNIHTKFYIYKQYCCSFNKSQLESLIKKN